MPLKFNAPQGAGAPEVEDGLNQFKFIDMIVEDHDDWAVESDKFGKKDDGQRWAFLFALLDEDGDEVFDVDTGEPIIIKTLTRVAIGDKSNAYALLTGMMSPAEKSAFDSQPAGLKDAEFLSNRRVYGIVEHSAKGWPNVASTTPFKKAPKKAATADGA